MEKVNFYYDGFNLYFGMRSKYGRRYLWLDLEKLSKLLLKPRQEINEIKYFTARIKDSPAKEKRQNTYLDALQSLRTIKIFYGHYLTNQHICPKCRHLELIPTEKMTDVNIATELLVDAFNNSFDVGILVSADSDLVGPIKQIRSLFPKKKIVIAFPPDRDSYELKHTAHAYFRIGRKKFQNSQFQHQITSLSGYPLMRPSSWKQ